jgi:NDP-sugar pyrophosphorylase family protein
VGVREYSQQVPYGVVEVEAEKVSQIVEKPVYRYFVNAGIYALSPEVLNQIVFNEYLDMPNLIDALMAKKEIVGAFPVTEYWKDIGHLPDLEEAQVDYEIHFTPVSTH